jgi:hypothetical protein
MTQPSTALDHAAHLEALADHLDPNVPTSEPVEADPDTLREVATRLRRIYAGGDPDAAAQQPQG